MTSLHDFLAGLEVGDTINSAAFGRCVVTAIEEHHDMTGDEIARRYREVIDRKDELNAEVAACDDELRELKRKAIAWGDEQGLDTIKGSGITLSLKDEPIAAVADWPTFIRWASECGFTDLLQKRANAKRAHELAVEGIPLPDCVELGTVRIVRHRRTSK